MSASSPGREPRSGRVPGGCSTRSVQLPQWIISDVSHFSHVAMENRYRWYERRCGGKFLRAFRAGERFFNIFTRSDSFNLIALVSVTPVYAGRTWGGMVMCQYVKFFQDFSSKNYERSYGFLR